MVQDNDDFIELTDVVEEDSSQKAGPDIIELTQVVPGGKELKAAAPEDKAPEKNDLKPSDPDVTVDAIGLDGAAADRIDGPEVRDSEPAPEVMPIQTNALGSITQDTIEAALERIIEKKFSSTIESILFEVMEKVIQKEIADIKTSLQKDLDDIGRA